MWDGFHSSPCGDDLPKREGFEETGFKVKESLAVDDCYFIDGWMKKLIAIIGNKNWRDGKYPTFETSKPKSIDVKGKIEAIRCAYEHGARVHISNYEQIGVKVDTRGEENEWIQKQSLNEFEL